MLQHILRSFFVSAFLTSSPQPPIQEAVNVEGVSGSLESGGEALFLSPGPPRPLNPNLDQFDSMDDFIDQLTRKMDTARKRIKRILNDPKPKTTKEELESLQGLVAEIDQLLESKSFEKLPDEAAQELGTSGLNIIASMKKVNEKLSDLAAEIKAEAEKQKKLLTECIQYINDEEVFLALKIFGQIKNPAQHIQQIITEATKKEQNCKATVTFTNNLENKLRLTAVKTLMEKVKGSEFTPKISSCLYKLGWNLKKFKKDLENLHKPQLSRELNEIISTIPNIISRFTISNENKLPLQETQYRARKYQTCYYNKKGVQVKESPDQLWTVETSNGEEFFVLNSKGFPLMAASKDEGRSIFEKIIHLDLIWKILGSSNYFVYLGNKPFKDEVNNVKGMWTLEPISETQFHVRSKAFPTQYLSAHLVSGGLFSRSCLQLSLHPSSTKSTWVL